jgi:Zn-dependent peptidase ImmA (M78 family)/DNA-binding XRE family transcriptional regulator
MAEFNPSRLEIARKRRGLTKTKLAGAAGISTRILTDYQRGDAQPGPDTARQIARVLRFPLDFFYLGDLDAPEVDAVSFRALSSMSARQRDQALGSAAIAIELADWIDARFRLPQPDVPRLPDVDPETAAELVRDAWGLGREPAPNLVHLLEAHGVRVFSLALDNAEVDAFSFWRDGVPYIFLNTRKSGERSRMDAAHELGHLVLHWAGGPQGREQERDAQAFGGAFLMPRASVVANVPRGARLNQIVQAKRYWSVAAANLAYRMHTVGMLTDWQYRAVFVEMSKRGYRTDEPNGIHRETSQVLNKVFRTLRDEGTTHARVAEELGLSTEELGSVIFGLVLAQVSSESAASQSAPKTNLRLV